MIVSNPLLLFEQTMLHIAMTEKVHKPKPRYIPADCNAQLSTTIGDFAFEIKWILYENGIAHVRGASGTKRYPKWRLFGNIFGQKTYTKSQITVTGAEQLFWSLITLLHMMSTRWQKMAKFKYKYAEYIGTEKFQFMVFPWWELSVKINGIEYILKYLSQDSKKTAKICIWTESKFQSRYITEFVPNIHAVPDAVKYMMDLTDEAEEEEDPMSIDVFKLSEAPLFVEVDLDDCEPLNQVTQHSNVKIPELTVMSIPKSIRSTISVTRTIFGFLLTCYDSVSLVLKHCDMYVCIQGWSAIINVPPEYPRIEWNQQIEN